MALTPQSSKSAQRVLIAGAGPVGLTAALNLARRGIAVTVLEAGDKIFDDPRAGTIHPPTLEMFADGGVTDAMLARGYIVRNYQYRDRRTGVVADFDLGALADDTPYPYRLMLEQHKICAILLDKLKAYPHCEVRMEHRVASVTQDGDGVTATVEPPQSSATFRGAWMIGCDGGRSQVRKSMNVDFSGFTYEERFLILSTRYDFAPHGYALTNYIADPDEWCALFKVPGHDEQGIWRVVFPVDAHRPVEEIFEEDAVQRRIQNFHRKDGGYDVVHRNLYSVHQRVASCYRDGRLLLAGDAAHINNPLGGMGMNSASTTRSIWPTSSPQSSRATRARTPSTATTASAAPSRRSISSARPSRTSAISSRRIRASARNSTTNCAPLPPIVSSFGPISSASP
jgi:3-(3-hydroxy-phenyl)propionate hydroxylase